MQAVRVVIALLVTTTAFAGCLRPDVEESASFTLNRQINVEINGENVAALRATMENDGAPDPYLFLASAFVVTVREAGVSPADVVLAYTDKDGRDVARPLSEFTSKTALEPGDAIRIEGVNLTSRALLTHKGDPVGDRARSSVDWWTIGGYPIGYAMAPGSSIAYDVSAGVSERFSLSDLKPKEEDVTIESAEASFSLDYDGTLTLTYGAAPETKMGEKSHLARPLSWTAAGKVSTPAVLAIKGSDASTGETIDAGIESLASTGVTFDAHGKFWINETRAPVLAEIEGGSWSSQADVIAWLTGTDFDAAANFSCAGKSRADACRPTEFDLEEAAQSETIEPDSGPLDDIPWDVDAEILDQLTAFLLEDLRPGDHVSFHLDLSEEDFPEFTAEDGAPETLRLVLDAEIVAQGFENVAIAGRDFEAIKVVERVGVRVEVGAISSEGETVFEGITIDQRFVDLTMWLAKGSFVPLRIEQTIPFDVGAVIGDALDAMGPDVWESAPIEPLDSEDLTFTTETRTAIELTKLEGDVQHSPWLLLGGFNAMWSGFPLMGLGMPFGAGGEFAEPPFPQGMCLEPEPGEPPMPCEDAYGYEGYGYDDAWRSGEDHPEPVCTTQDENGERVETACEDMYGEYPYGDPYGSEYGNWSGEEPQWNESSANGT